MKRMQSLYKTKSNLSIEKIYFEVNLHLLMLIITGIDFYGIKRIITKNATFSNNVHVDSIQLEIILEKTEIIIEVNESINIKK